MLWTLDNNLLNIKLSKEGWTSQDVVVTVGYNDATVDITKYSFDGGKTWQKENTYTVSENTTLDIVVKSKSGIKTKAKSYEIKNIDKKGPTIKIDKNITLAQGTEFDLNDYLKVSDDISGIKGNISVTPSEIDTDTIGLTKISIRAVDNAGNETVVESYIDVVEENAVTANMEIDKDSNKKKEYRYRKINKDCKTNTEYVTPNYYFGNESCDLYNGITNGRYCLSSYIVYDDICSNGKIVDGQCHDIIKEAKVTCPSGTYDRNMDQCIVDNSNCVESYGDWSEWSTEEIEEAEDIEIETREVE